MHDEDWERLRGGRSDRSPPRISPVRVALLFGTAAIAFALFATSYLANDGRVLYAETARSLGLDDMTTGSISSGTTYTIRRSVLQSSPEAVCIIEDNGRRVGDC